MEELDNLCRSCLLYKAERTNDETKMVPLSFVPDESKAANLSLEEILKAIVPQLKISENCDLPKNVCKKCVGKIIDFYNFQLTYIKNQEKVHELLEVGNISDLLNTTKDQTDFQFIKNDFSNQNKANELLNDEKDIKINFNVEDNNQSSIVISEENNDFNSDEKREDRCDTHEGSAGIDPDRTVESTWHEVYDTFDGMNLREELLSGIYAYGFVKPLAIQQRAIIPCIRGRDVIVQALSGTGKTFTSLIAILQKIDTSIRDCQALILVPTRELAIQSQCVVMNLGKYMKVHSHACIRRTSAREDKRIREGVCHVVVGTPGLLYNFIKRKEFFAAEIKLFIWEVHEGMISPTLNRYIQHICKILPTDVQFILLSATMQPGVLEFSDSFMRDPVSISIKKELNLDSIKQFYVNVRGDKLRTLCDLCHSFSIRHSIIFCNTSYMVSQLTKGMTDHNFTVASMHGCMKLSDRKLLMQQFRYGYFRIFITTDFMDGITDVQHDLIVINYDLPSTIETYNQRIGRVDWFGRKTVINFNIEEDRMFLKDIEKFYDTTIGEMPANIANLI